MFLTIEYVPVDFPKSFGTKLLEPNKLHCVWADIVRSAITVGRKDWPHVFRHQMHSAFEIIYRSAMLYANLKSALSHSILGQPSQSYVFQSSAYEGLDTSEKSAISYFLGLTMSKLFADKLLDVPWLMHLDVYKDQLDIDSSTHDRPDLVGIDSKGRWIVIEAKGRSNRLEKQVMLKAKRQAMSLTKIAGTKPYLYVALAGCFSSRNNALKIYAKDPPTNSEGGFQLAIYEHDYLLDYYEPLIEFIRSDQERPDVVSVFRDQRYLVKRVQEVDVWLGLDEQVYRWLSRASDEDLSTQRLLHLAGQTPGLELETLLEISYRAISVGPDGVYVQLGDRWDNELMSLEPRERPPRP